MIQQALSAPEQLISRKEAAKRIEPFPVAAAEVGDHVVRPCM
jgi:hypothetical protein